MAEYIYRAEPIGEGEYSHTLVGELVRCGECKYSCDYKHTKDYVNCQVDSSESIDRNPNWFCADGERRADDE